jgi:lysophospholipase L1-like esterase
MDKIRRKIAFLGDSLTEGIVGASYFDILQEKLSSHELFNYGKGGDTVVSLYRRLRRSGMATRFDLGVLWIGVNDVFVKTHWFYPIKKRLRRQPWAKNKEEFRQFYHSLLEFLRDNFSSIFTLPPLFIGEESHNKWNRELEVLSTIIQDLSLVDPLTEFIDIRQPFLSRLGSKGEKGLFFTIDGVHLSKEGAALVAEILQEKICLKFPLAAGHP